MRRDPTKFRERFNAWKNGELVYQGGRPTELPGYEGGKDELERAIDRFDRKSKEYPQYDELTIPFDKSKKLVLSDAGLATGAIISENLLDSIYKYSKKAELPLKTALGIVTKESTLGNPTDDRSLYRLMSDDILLATLRGQTGQHLNTTGANVSARELVNYYKDTWNPYETAIKFAKRKAAKLVKRPDGNVYDRNGNIIGTRAYHDDPDYINYKNEMALYEDKYNLTVDSILISGEKYADRIAEKNKSSIRGNVLEAAFKDYKTNPNNYNPGQKNYRKLVEKRGNEVMRSPQIQQWLKKRGYKDGKDDDITTLREVTVTPDESYAMASSDDMRRDLHYNIARAKYKNNLDAYNLQRNMNAAQEGVAMNFGLPLVMGLAGSPVDIGVEGAINLGKAGLNLLRRGGKSLARVGGDIVRLGNVGLGKQFKLNYYTDFITGESIAPAYIPTEYYPKIRPIDDYVGTSLSNSTVPRMAALRPKMSPRQVALEADRAASGTYFEFPEQAYIEAGKKNVGGLYNPRKNYISIREGRADEGLTHEVRHRLDQYMPLTESELKYLNDAFTSDFDAMTNLPAYKDVDLGAEKVTTIGDARRALLGDQKDWDMPWTQLNVEIDKARDIDVIDALLKSNGYGRSYVEQLKKKYGSVPTEVIKAIREAMKYVGVGAGVAVLKPKSKK